MTVKLANATRSAMTDARAALASGGKIEIRTGSQPATADSAATGSVLATLTLDSTPFGAASNGTAALADTPLEVDAGATGTAGYYRIYDSSDNPVEDGSCGTTGTDMILSTTSLVSGVQFSITSGSLSQPAS